MRKLIATVTVSALALGLSAAPLMAQQSNPESTGMLQNARQTGPAQGQPFRADLVRSEKVLGAAVYDANGKQIGEIKDVVFDENTGGATRAVLSVGDYLGIGDQLTPVEWNKINAVRTDNNNCRFTVTATKADLQKEQSFGPDNWPDFTNGWNGENVQGKKLVRMSQANDADLYDTNGNQIGGIKDLMLDTQSGRIAYAVVTFSNDFINRGDKLTMVPWNLVRQSQQPSPGYVLHANRSQLENATYFSPNQWPNVNNVTWNNGLYHHYGVTPYWTGS
jgi:sporulation protein YlmC with PRC-barrel domain